VHFLSRLETHLYCSVCYVVCNMRADCETLFGNGEERWLCQDYICVSQASMHTNHSLVGLGYSGRLKMCDKDKSIFMKYVYLASASSNVVNYYLKNAKSW
jgi:hypothetical protein